MIWLLIFLALNVLDAALTHYMLASGAQVYECNPLMAYVMSWGWTAVWLYKTVGALLLAGMLRLVFRRESWNRIMMGASIGFALIMIYMLALFIGVF